MSEKKIEVFTTSQLVKIITVINEAIAMVAVSFSIRDLSIAIAKNPGRLASHLRLIFSALLSGKVIVSQSAPPGTVTWAEVTVGGFDNLEHIFSTLSGAMVESTPVINEMLKNFNVPSPKVKEILELAEITPQFIGFDHGATLEEIYARAEEFRLEVCDSEVGPLASLLDLEPDKEYLIAIVPAVDSDGGQGIFMVRKDGMSGITRLLPKYVYKRHLWDSKTNWIFVKK